MFWQDIFHLFQSRVYKKKIHFWGCRLISIHPLINYFMISLLYHQFWKHFNEWHTGVEESFRGCWDESDKQSWSIKTIHFKFKENFFCHNPPAYFLPHLLLNDKTIDCLSVFWDGSYLMGHLIYCANVRGSGSGGRQNRNNFSIHSYPNITFIHQKCAIRMMAPLSL